MKNRAVPLNDESLRAFFAIGLSQSVKVDLDKLIDRLRARDHGNQVRWVRAANMHVTVYFIGNMAREIVHHLLHPVSHSINFIAIISI